MIELFFNKLKKHLFKNNNYYMNDDGDDDKIHNLVNRILVNDNYYDCCTYNLNVLDCY